MNTIECPSCRATFQMSPESLRGRSTIHCPGCGRVMVVPGQPAAALHEGPDTDAYVEPAPQAEIPTAIGAARALLSLPAHERVSIAILSGERKGDVVVLAQPGIVIGRHGAGADIELPDPDVSREHAAVDCRGTRIVLRDLGSRNGTFVGDQRVQTKDLEDKSEFRLGSTRLMLMLTPID
jgi:pSer/pThr/pTyr-binding forkhead associated (FHA) protein